MYLEKSVEKYLRKQVIQRGGLCIKQDTEAGIPDRLVLDQNGNVYWVELKRPDGRLSAVQVEFHQRLKDRHFKVYVLWNFEDVDKFISENFKEECSYGK